MNLFVPDLTYRTVDLTQGSSDWLTWRHQGLGASDAPVIWNGRHFDRTPETLLREKSSPPLTGRGADRVKSNTAAARGHALEPKARSRYQALTGLIIEPECGLVEEFSFLRASFDGLSLEHSLVLEIKCPNRWDHEEALNDRVPVKYQPQLWHQLLVSGCKRAHYVSYYPYFNAPEDLALTTLHRKDCPLPALFEKLIDFWALVQKARESA